MSDKGIGTPKGESRQRSLKIVDIPVAEIDTAGRIRPATAAMVEQLARDITARKLRLPVEVAKTEKGWRLVSGLHRLEACRLLGWTAIPAIVVKGTSATLRRDEYLENLIRNELTVLERCQVTAALKQQFLEENPEAGHGGDRRSADREQGASLASWYANIAARSERAKRTIQLQASIGERLDARAADRLRGTDFEDNQSELEALSKRHAEEQRAIAAMLTDPESPANNVREALAMLAGQPADRADGDERAIRGLVDRWRRWPRANRREFIYALTDEEFDEMVELRRARAGEAG